MTDLQAERGGRALLEQHGLTTFDAVVNLPAVLVGCHPGRHVARVTLGHEPAAIRAFLKREHRVSWKERLANWWAGFGLVSRSVREARVLAALHAAGIDCPEVVAAGEAHGRGAFLLLRERTGWVELRTFLRDHLPADPVPRRRFADALGQALARVHAAGFDHPDLYSKHVLVHPRTCAICFLDWQRSRRHRRLSAARRCRDLAALDATLGEELAPPRARLACLRAYLEACDLPAKSLGGFTGRIRAESRRLQGKRRVRELRQEPLPEGAQSLVRRAHGTIFAAPSFLAEATPALRNLLSYAGFPPGVQEHAEQMILDLPEGRRLLQVRRRVHRPRGWFWAWLRRRPLLSPEREQADALFRLQRYGVPTPRLLAYGQRQEPPWRQESLLLVELPLRAVPLAEWLGAARDSAERRHVLNHVGRLLRRMHEAGHYLGRDRRLEERIVVGPRYKGSARVLLGSVNNLEVRRQPREHLATRDLADLQVILAEAGCAGTEQLGLLRAYLGRRRLTVEGKRLARRLWRGSRPAAARAARARQSESASERPHLITATECGAEA